jgi:tRNA pseudouridine38-40 synthase
MRRPSSSSSSSETSASGAGSRRTTVAGTTAREGSPVRFAARVEYDGTDFAGFQVQPGRRTVQGELETALARLGGGTRIRIDGAGRTDAGVHAQGQVIAFTWTGRLPADGLVSALRAVLPPDVGIGRLWQVPAGFRPRHAASRREYRYTIWNGPRSPLRERYALGYRDVLDVEAMDRAAQALVGRHDFSAFGGWDRQPIRTLHGVRVRRNGRTITIDVMGDAFLRQMVRSIVAALLRVGRGEATAEDLEAALRSPGRAFAGAIAPPHGLCLRRVVLGRRQTGQDEDDQDLLAAGS